MTAASAPARWDDPADFMVVRQGGSPLLLSVPHAGTELPGEVASQLRDPVKALEDTDWHVDRLYAFGEEMDATIVRTRLSRIVIDVNRDPSGASLYPGQATTGLVPVVSFAGEPLYRDGQEPDEAEVARRRARAFDPYHAVLEEQIRRLRAAHPRIVLYDCHSIRSRVPRLFDGELPVFNIGTNGRTSADPVLVEAVIAATAALGETFVVDGRFRGGWITRHHGRPRSGVHAVQMELSQIYYMDEDRPDSLEAALEDRLPKAAAGLRTILEAVMEWLKR